MSKEVQNVIDSHRIYDPKMTLPLRNAILKLFKSRRGKWLSNDWIYYHLGGRCELRSLGSSIRDLRRKKYGAYCVDSKIEKELVQYNGGSFERRVLYYRFRGKQADNQMKLRMN